MEVEEISPHAQGGDGAGAMLRRNSDLRAAAVGVHIEAAVLRRLQGLLHHGGLQLLPEGEDIRLLLPLPHGHVAGHLGKAHLALPPEPVRRRGGIQGVAHRPQPQQAGQGGQRQHHVQPQQEPLLKAKAPDILPHLAEDVLTSHALSTILTWVPASRGLLAVVIT